MFEKMFDMMGLMGFMTMDKLDWEIIWQNPSESSMQVRYKVQRNIHPTRLN